MEFFRIIHKQVSEDIIQEQITPQSVNEFADTMLYIDGHDYEFRGMTLWGEFRIGFNKIKGGVKFSLLDCPNALSWSITNGYPPEKNHLILHCTINRTQKPAEFLEEINEFLDEWQEGLKSKL
jgi:hypothetical protein